MTTSGLFVECLIVIQAHTINPHQLGGNPREPSIGHECRYRIGVSPQVRSLGERPGIGLRGGPGSLRSPFTGTSSGERKLTVVEPVVSQELLSKSFRKYPTNHIGQLDFELTQLLRLEHAGELKVAQAPITVYLVAVQNVGN
jgi:hypothetical protein